jgi:hypothetical protein
LLSTDPTTNSVLRSSPVIVNSPAMVSCCEPVLFGPGVRAIRPRDDSVPCEYAARAASLSRQTNEA